MSRVLVTGVAGFLGSHLAESLRDAGHTVTGTVRTNTVSLDGVAVVPCDITDAKQVRDIVASVRPEIVFHFAAQSLPVVSWRDPPATFHTNAFGTLNLLEAARRAAPDPLVVVAGSSAEYGPAPTGGPRLGEDAPIDPSSPYGASKAAATFLARFYNQSCQVKTIIIRPFLAIGPGKSGDMCSDFARGVVAVERGVRPALRVGNLDAVRDFLDARNVVDACLLIAERGTPGQTYNICSGAGHAVREVLETMLRLASAPVPVVSDPALARPADPDVIVGDNRRLRALGWEQTVSLGDSLAAILGYWRRHEAEVVAPVPQGARR